MKRLILLLAMGLFATASFCSAQGLFRMIGNAIGSEIKDEVTERVQESRERRAEAKQAKRTQREQEFVKTANKAKSAVVKLDNTKMYTQQEADSYYPPYNAITKRCDMSLMLSQGLGLHESPIDMWAIGNYRKEALYVDKMIITINDTNSWEYLGVRLQNLKEVWYGPEVDVAKIFQKYAERTEEYVFYSHAANSRECTIFLPADKYPKGMMSIQEELLKSGCATWKSIPTEMLKFKTMTYTGDVTEAAARGAVACKSYCPGHDFSARVTAAHTVMRYGTCQANTKFYYSCKYCGECEHNAKHTFEENQYAKRTTEKYAHMFVKYDLSAKNYVGRNARGESVYYTTCYWCGKSGREEIEDFTQADLVKNFGYDAEFTLAQYKEAMLSSWDGARREDALENVYVGGFDYPGYFAVPDDDHGARVSPQAENDTRWAMVYGLVDKTVLGDDYLKSVTHLQVASLAVRLAESVTGKEIKIASAGVPAGMDNIYVSKAYAAGIMPMSCAEGFQPDALVTRQEMATYMFNALQYIKEHSAVRYTVYTPNLEVFADRAKIADWAVEAMGFMNTLGFIKGSSKSGIEPLRNCSIEEAVVLANKCFHADELGWYQCIRPNERGFAGSPGGAYDWLGIAKNILAMPARDGDIVIRSFDNCDRIWVGDNWVGRGLSPKSQREVFLPFVDEYSGNTLFVLGEEFLPIKDI